MRKNEAAWLENYNRWQIKVQKERVRKTFTSSTPGKKGKIECEKKADKWLISGISDSSIRFAKAYQMFLEEKLTLKSHSTWQKHYSIGKVWLLPKLEYKKLSCITNNNLEQIILESHKMGKAKKTISNIKGTMTAFSTFCKKNGWSFPSMQFIEIPKNAPSKEKHILQPEDIQKLFNNDYDEFYIYAFRFFAVVGLRRGELCGLMNEDIKGHVAYIRRSINEYGEITEGKTKNAKRATALCSTAIDILSQQKSMLKKNGIISPYVFPKKNGTVSSPNSIYSSWVRYRKKIGISCSLHELRHTLISYASATVPETLLKKSIGHSKSMDTFGIYTHSVNDEAARVASLLDERFNGIL